MNGKVSVLDSIGNIYTVGCIGITLHLFKYNNNGNVIWHTTDSIQTTGSGICAASDNQGNIYITANGFVGPNGAYLRTLKYDSAGTRIWLKFCFAAEAKAMCLDNLGNIYITGRITISGRYNYITIKYNPQGDTLWNAVYGSPYIYGGSMANSICVDLQRNVYVTGGSINSTTSNDYVTVKYNSNGIQQWVSKYDGPVHSQDVGYCVKTDLQGNCYVTGLVTYDTSKSLFGTIKYTPNGDSVWTRLYVPQLLLYNEFGNDLVIDGSGNVYVTGHGSDNVHIAGVFRTLKYDKYGNFIWNRIDTNGYTAKAITISKNNSVYLTGENGNIGLYSLGYDLNGVKIFGDLYPPNYPNRPYSGFQVILDRYDNLFIFGSSLDSSILLKYSNLTLINLTHDIKLTNYKLEQNYPNPFNPTTKIKFSVVSSPHVSGGDLVLLKVYDVMGREVQTLVNESLKPGTYEVSFDGSALTSGVYFYKLIIRHGGSSTGGFTETKKMLMIK